VAAVKVVWPFSRPVVDARGRRLIPRRHLFFVLKSVWFMSWGGLPPTCSCDHGGGSASCAWEPAAAGDSRASLRQLLVAACRLRAGLDGTRAAVPLLQDSKCWFSLCFISKWSVPGGPVAVQRRSLPIRRRKRAEGLITFCKVLQGPLCLILDPSVILVSFWVSLYSLVLYPSILTGALHPFTV
jgi:hypothetical protein